ncbi:hypothetical protein [Paenibacillus sp. FSL E2-0190]|uniref:hypothetical protein n=1 Tax=Paenibacillus sp. FSL E2-0190 TaxID=2954504 RepID=UPI0030EB5EF0
MVRYRRTFLEEYETLAGDDPNGPFAGDFREEIGEFVIEYIAEHGKSPSNKEIIENCISSEERIRLESSLIKGDSNE